MYHTKASIKSQVMTVIAHTDDQAFEQGETHASDAQLAEALLARFHITAKETRS